MINPRSTLPASLSTRSLGSSLRIRSPEYIHPIISTLKQRELLSSISTSKSLKALLFFYSGSNQSRNGMRCWDCAKCCLKEALSNQICSSRRTWCDKLSSIPKKILSHQYRREKKKKRRRINSLITRVLAQHRPGSKWSQNNY